MRPEFASSAAFHPGGRYALLPFRFVELSQDPGRVLVVNEVGEYLFLSRSELRELVAGTLPPSAPAFDDLLARQFISTGDTERGMRTLAAKYRTKKSFLHDGPSLHLFVVTLRCNHSCLYCQVSRQSPDKHLYDMSDETAGLAVERLFESPAPHLTVEFQGGEPLLAFDRIVSVVNAIKQRNEWEGRSITFTVTSTLHHVSDPILDFMREHRFQVSTSIDGPAWLHNANRPTKTGDAFEKTVAGVARVRDALGSEALSALTTITRRSLSAAREIIDAYVQLGFPSVFLRPLTPLGFAARSERKIGYSMAEFAAFYGEALSYILELRRAGVEISETYAGILLTHILTPFPTGYVDLRSPVGAGFGALVYNYDGRVYASDEGRMLAEMGDHSLSLGTVRQSYRELMRSPAMQLLAATGVAESLPGCSDCAFVPYCGADPTLAVGRGGDPIGHRYSSHHCQRHMPMFHSLFRLLAQADEETFRMLLRWTQPYSPARAVQAA